MPHGLISRALAYPVSLPEAPMKTIVASTSLNAEILGLQDRIGSVTAGKLADLIAVGGNPLADVGVVENVLFVMKGGIIFRQDEPYDSGRCSCREHSSKLEPYGGTAMLASLRVPLAVAVISFSHRAHPKHNVVAGRFSCPMVRAKTLSKNAA